MPKETEDRTLRKWGDSVGVTIPPVLRKHGWEDGQKITFEWDWENPKELVLRLPEEEQAME